MAKLTDLPNLGEVIEKRLNAIGIWTAEELVQAGSKDVFIRMKMAGGEVCLHMLYALQGAIEGIRYTQLAPGTKQELKQYYKKA